MTFIASTPPIFKYPSIDRFYLQAITMGIYEAWKALPARKILTKDDYSDEDKVSAEVKQILNEFLAYNTLEWFTRDDFETVVREDKMKNFDGKSHDFMPDLIFRIKDKFVGADEHYAIFIECKTIIDSKSIYRYIANGVIRFTEGDYAWKMPHAMMVAYVHNNSKLPILLDEYFKKSRSIIVKSNRPSKPLTMSDFITLIPPSVYASTHKRSFFLPDGSAPDDVELHHLWLDVPDFD